MAFLKSQNPEKIINNRETIFVICDKCGKQYKTRNCTVLYKYHNGLEHICLSCRQKINIQKNKNFKLAGRKNLREATATANDRKRIAKKASETKKKRRTKLYYKDINKVRDNLQKKYINLLINILNFVVKEKEYTVYCKNCGIKFYYKPIKERKRKFCSKSCANSYNSRGDKNVFARKDVIEKIKKINAGKKFTEEHKTKLSKARKKFIRNGGSVWNKGLTKEENETLMNWSIRMKEHNPMYDEDAKNKMKETILYLHSESLIDCSNFKSGYIGKLYYASSYEKKFIKECIKNNIKIERVKLENFVPYTFEGKEHKYIPDFILNDEIVIEIKPSVFIKNKINVAKFKAAYVFFKNKRMKFKIKTENHIEKEKLL